MAGWRRLWLECAADHSAQVTAEEEMQRMRCALTIVRGQQPDAVLSIDTFRPEIARMAVEEFGAAIINDVSEGNINGAFGGADATNPNGETESDDSRYPAIFRMVAKLGVPYILMSTHGEMDDIMINLAREVQMLRDLGVKDIILDPYVYYVFYSKFKHPFFSLLYI